MYHQNGAPVSKGIVFSIEEFAIIAGLSFVFALWLPETKGKSLETIQKELVEP